MLSRPFRHYAIIALVMLAVTLFTSLLPPTTKASGVPANAASAGNVTLPDMNVIDVTVVDIGVDGVSSPIASLPRVSRAGEINSIGTSFIDTSIHDYSSGSDVYVARLEHRGYALASFQPSNTSASGVSAPVSRSLSLTIGFFLFIFVIGFLIGAAIMVSYKRRKQENKENRALANSYLEYDWTPRD